MVQIRPQSPPSSNGDDLLHQGFHHLVHHNVSTSFPHQNYEYDARHHLPSGTDSTFPSPAPRYQDDRYYHGSQQPQHPYQQQYQDTGPGFKFDGYPSQTDQYGVKQSDRVLFSGRYGTPEGSSPTQPMPPAIGNTMRTRSGRAVESRPLQPLKPLPQTKSKPAKAPKTKKTKKNQKNPATPENRSKKLETPLSELTKDFDHVPLVDIEAYVNRSAEERREEVEHGKSPGKVKRPMNSFMLYRKAYQNRCKALCFDKNHQVVSQTCGDSWPLEPESVREQFNEWSRIERTNHQNAHPGYKFSPSKGTPTKATKRKVSEEPDSEESDLEDFDWEKGTTKRSKKRSRSVSRPLENRSFSTTQSSYGYSQSRQVSEEPSYSSWRDSSYQASNPGKTVPMPYDQSSLHNGQYYHQIVRPNLAHAGIEDVVIKKTAVLGMGHLGLPGGHAYTVTDPYLSQEGMVTPEHRIDPILIAQDNGHYSDAYVEQEGLYLGGNLDDGSQWHGSYGGADRVMYQDSSELHAASEAYHGMQLHDQQLQILKGNQEGWEMEPLDAGQEFEKWIADEEHF